MMFSTEYTTIKAPDNGRTVYTVPMGMPREAVTWVMVSFMMLTPPYSITTAASSKTRHSLMISSTLRGVPVILSAKKPIRIWSRLPNTSALESRAIQVKL